MYASRVIANTTMVDFIERSCALQWMAATGTTPANFAVRARATPAFRAMKRWLNVHRTLG
jgi:hypothetical protein